MPRILIADDNTNIQKMVSLAFQDSDIQVTSVGNGEAAVRRLADVNPDLVLADIFMPVRNGYEVCEYIKKDQRFAHVPVILLVGAFDPLDEKEARRVGADGILKKPFVPPDPLVAMVTSALEKNPRVAAEMAKAKAAKEVVPEPEPVAQPEVLGKKEIKPLPEFPEPSPEEAALIYGFGKGKRIIEDAAAKGVAELPAPVNAADQEEEDFESASTARDWRRAAGDFEVPAELANQPAFAAGETADAFAADHDFSSKAGRSRGPKIESAAVEREEAMQHNAQPVQAEAFTAAFEAAAADSLSVPLIEVESTPEPFSFAPEPAQAAEAFDAPVLEAVSTAPISVEPRGSFEEAPAAANAPRRVMEEPAFPSQHVVEEASFAQAEPAVDSSAAAPVTESEEKSPSVVRHWMDALSGGSSVLGGWLGALKGKREGKESEQNEAQQDSTPLPWEGTEAQPSPNFDLVAEKMEAPTPVASAPAEVVATAQAAFSVPAAEPQAAAGNEDAFFANEPKSESSTPAPWTFESPATAVASATPARAEGLIDEFAAVRVTPEPLLEAEAPAEPRQMFRDPALVEPPPVHVQAEPLLEAEEPEESRQMFRDPGLVEPPPVRMQSEPLLEDVESEPSPQSHLQGEELSPAHSFSTPDAPAPAAEHFAEEFGERIPTGPPPNRQALADIPFLSPPPDFGAPQREEMTPEAMDAIVQKVVEKLGPQLQSMLSQNVLKPLVENMLHSELTKKD